MKQGKRQRIDWSIVSRYRGEVFGISTILVIICHFAADALYSNISATWKSVLMMYDICYNSGGVELFLFLSGVGLCFSLKKRGSLKAFYLKRFTRLLGAYVIFGSAYWIILDLVIRGGGIFAFLYDFFLISFWTEGDRSFWFIAFIVIMYLVYPLIYRCFSTGNRYRFLWFVALNVAVFLIWYSIKCFAPAVYANTEIALLRPHIFLFGAYYGEKIYNRAPFSLGDKLLLSVGLGIKLISIGMYLQDHSASWLAYNRLVACLFSLPVLFALCFLFSKLPDGWFLSFLRKVGEYSLELYITHVGIWIIFGTCGRSQSPRNFVLVVILSIFSSLAVKMLADRLVKFLDRVWTAREKQGQDLD